MLELVDNRVAHHLLDEEIIAKWRKILKLLVEMNQVETCGIIQADEDSLQLIEKYTMVHRSDEMMVNVINTLYAQIVTSGSFYVKDLGKYFKKYNQVSFIGVPMSWANGDTFGVLCLVHSKEKVYDEGMIRIIKQFKRMLENDLTMIKQNKSLDYHINEVKRTQKLLMKYEKEHLKQQMIASIGHELSTPIHVALNVSEYLESSTELEQVSNLEPMLIEGVELLYKNLEIASHQLRAFQKLANDQINQQVDVIDIGLYLQSIVQNMHLHLMKYKAEVNLIVRSNLSVQTIPGILSQVLIVILNKMMVSFYNPDEVTLIVITVKELDDQIHIYIDGGKQTNVSYESMDRWDKGLKLATLVEWVQEKLQGLLIFEDEGDITFYISIPNKI